MINAIKRFFGLHIHEWGPWTMQKAVSNQFGTIQATQTRTCETCGYTQLDKQTV